MNSQQNLANDFSSSSKIENAIERESDKSGMINIDIDNADNGGNSNQKRVLTPQEISKPFRIMAYRKSGRQVRGRYRRRSYTRIFWFIMFMLVFLSLVGVGLGRLLSNVSTWGSWPEFVIFVTIFTIVMYIYYKITEVIRWCFYWLAIATIILLIINRGSLISEDNGFASTPKTRTLIIVLIVVESLTLFTWIIVRYIYPRIVEDAEWLDTVWWWRISQANNVHIHGKDAVGCFRYLAWENYSLWFRHGTVTYIGEVNANGRPHGHGEWVDDSSDGECLKGVWNDGVPVGPFQSRGSGTGDAFHAVRVGLVKNSHTPWDEWRLFPRPYQSGLDVAVASVECSVSGKYLKNLPRSTLILSPKSRDEETIIENCLKNLTTFASVMESDSGVKDATQSSVIINAEDDGFAITGFYPINAMTSCNEVIVRRVPKKKDSEHTKIEYTLEINGWKPFGTSPSPNSNPSGFFRGSMECVVFIHGFNCPPKYAMETLGQFLALGDFPSYIKPFVFSPPGTNSLWYFGVKEQASSEQAINDFRTFLQDLRDAGFRAVHILSHSMGGMLTLQYAKAFDGVFQKINSSDNDTRDTIQHSENEESYFRSGTLMKLSTVTLLNPDTSLNQFISQGYVRLIKYCDHITIYSNARDFALRIGEIIGREASLGRQTSDLHYDGKLMNVDLIDTTQLDVNIHKVRHNFFNLNRLLVDDLRDIIVIRRRARERRLRLNRKVKGVGLEGIVYTFLVAPSYVVNK